MKKSVLGLLLFILCAVTAQAGETSGYTPPKISGELEKIKALEGKWTGTTREGDKEATSASAEYHVTSGGTAVEEKLFPGTPHEMVSMYHDASGKLSMTHYCMLGNQPELEMKNTDAGRIDLKESAASAALLSGQMRMGSLSVAWVDKDHIVQTWTAQDAEGKLMESTVITLSRANG